MLRVIGVSLFFIALFTLTGFVIGAAGVFFGLWNMQILAVVSMIFAMISILLVAAAYHYAPSVILKKYKAKTSDKKEINAIVDKMAINAKIPTPKVCVLPIDVPNSFIVGRNRNDTTVCVTEGVLSMNKGEIENIVAHEMWHVYNGDYKIQQFVSVVAAVLRKTGIFIPLAMLTVRLGLSERVEYRADYYATRFSGKPRDLASALNKMSETARQNPMHGSPTYESIWIINPFKREGHRRWYYTHPPTVRRAKRVEEMTHEGMSEVPEATEVD